MIGGIYLLFPGAPAAAKGYFSFIVLPVGAYGVCSELWQIALLEASQEERPVVDPGDGATTGYEALRPCRRSFRSSPLTEAVRYLLDRG